MLFRDLTHSCTFLLHSVVATSPFCPSLPLTCALLAFTLLLPFLPSSLLSPSSCPATSLPLFQFSPFLPPDIQPPLLTTPRSLLSNQIHNGAHSLKIFPLHSNAPPHHCNSAATDAGRRCDANYIRGDYILPRLIFPAVARRDSLSFTACSYFIPVFLFFSSCYACFFPSFFFLSLSSIHFSALCAIFAEK